MIVTLNFLVIMSITLNFVVKKVDFFPQEKKFLLAVERGDVASTRRLVFSFGLISESDNQIYLQFEKIYNIWVMSDLYNLKRLT